MRFNYQLYTSPWSQLGELKFDDCIFNGIIVGATAAQTLTFDGCEFRDFTNTIDANNSNPTWIRPAYGNWNAGDNEGQGDDFRSLTEINFTNNKVTSTRPVKFEYISQWDKTSTVTATNNYFDISAQNGDTSTKNVGLYLGAHKDDNEFNLIVENNSKSEDTAALYTIPEGEKSLPAGSTVKDSKGNEITITDALEWKTKNPVELKTEYQDSAVAGINGVSYDSLDEAITNAKDGDTITILKAAEDANGYKLNGGLSYSDKAITIKAASGADVKFDMSTAVALQGAKITFEGVTFEYNTNSNYVGLQHTDTMVYNNCVFNGQMFLYGASETFNGCTFNQTSSDAYNVWTYGAKKVDFNGCTFKCAGKSVLVYNEGTISGTDLTVTDTTFHASQSVEDKAAIEIDTSLMKGQTKITVDQATANKTTGFGTGSNSGSSLWNDKKQTVETNKNTTVVVAGKTVFEPTCVDLDTFIKMVENSNYNFDGTLANGKKLTVKWSPVSGCFDTRSGHTCTVKNAAATGNTPNRVNSDLAQYQLFKAATDVTIKNVNFEYIPADFTICANSGWAGSWTGDVVKSAQLQLETTGEGDVTIEGCSFNHVVFTSWQNSGETVIKNSAFKNIYGSYAIKDLGGSSVEVSDCTFENCGGGIMLDSNSGRAVTPDPVTISGNTFTKVDVDGTTPENEVSTRGLLQIPSKGDYTNTAIILDGNTASNCGPILRQLNHGIADKDVLKNNLTGDLTGLGGKLTFTSDSVKKAGESEPAQPTVYTVKFENADVADMKVIEGTKITLPTPGNRPNYTFEGWYVGNTKVSSPYTVSSDVTLVAQWRYIGQGGGSSSSSGDYSISVDADKHGTVTVSPKRADKGDTVTITVDPDEGYELRKLQVIGPDGGEIALTKKADGTYTFKMPKGSVKVTAVFGCDGTGDCPSKNFTDLGENQWYHDAVDYVVEHGIMTGTSATTFEPNTTLSRAMVAQILYNLEGQPTVTGESTFTDSNTHWAAKAIAWAQKTGVVSGYGNNTFRPNQAVTREELAQMLYNYAEYKQYDLTASGDLTAFPDVSKVSDWAETAMSWANGNQLINGFEDDTLRPGGNSTRAQAASILMNFDVNLAN